MRNIAIIYHDNCIDGATAAAVAMFYLRENEKDVSITLVSLSYGYKSKDLKLISSRDEIYIVDFSLKLEDYVILFKLNPDIKIVNIDHHIGAKDIIEKVSEAYNLEYVYDTDKSGALLTYEYFVNKYSKEDEYIKEIAKYVSDRDIWKFEFGEETENLNTYLFTLLSKDAPAIIYEILIKRPSIEELMSMGKSMLRFKEHLIESILKNYKATYINVSVNGQSNLALIINSNVFQSELGNRLSKEFLLPVIIYSISDDIVFLSIRSIDESPVKALEIAKALGGGGHVHAAGAKLDRDMFCKIIDNKHVIQIKR